MTNKTISIVMEVFTKLVDAHDQIAIVAIDESKNLDCNKDDYVALCIIKKLAKEAANVSNLMLENHDIHFNGGKFYAPISEIVPDEDENPEIPADGGEQSEDNE